MLVYTKRDDTAKISSAIKQFDGGGIAAADFGSKDEYSKKFFDALKGLATKSIEVLKIKKGDLLHLKKGVAEVIYVGKSKDDGSKLPKTTIAIQYITGDNVGKKETKVLSIKDRLDVIKDKSKSQILKMIQGAKDKLSGDASKTQGELKKKAKDLLNGDIIQVSRGLARVDSVEKGYTKKSDDDDRYSWRSGSDKKVKVNYTYRSGELKGEKSYGLYSEDSEITIRPSETMEINDKKPESSSKEDKKQSEPRQVYKPAKPKEPEKPKPETIKENMFKIRGEMEELAEKPNRTEADVKQLRNLNGQYKELKAAYERLTKNSDMKS